MEDNNNKKGKRGVVDVSVVLSFVVAIFAVVSIAMAGLSLTQNSGVSYAAPTANDNDFTLKYDTEVIGADTYDKDYIATDGGTNYYIFPLYYGDSIATGNQVFCIERNKDVVNNSTYTKTAEEIDDTGLLYLLNLGYNDRDLSKINSNFNYPDDIDGWVIQSAIWYYLAEKYPDNSAYQLINEVDGGGQNLNDRAVMTASSVQIKRGRADSFTTYNHIASAISTLVANAKSATTPRVTVAAENNEYSQVEDGKFYVSSLINVTGTPSSSMTGYDISLSGINGAIIVDENGQEIASTTNVAPGTKIYVKVPSDNVTEKAQTVRIDVVGHFENGKVYKYTSAGSPQAMALIGPRNVSSGLELVFAPNTGMNTTQTIYFIGLIVLLCGVGIVYANAKPVQVKQ